MKNEKRYIVECVRDVFEWSVPLKNKSTLFEAFLLAERGYPVFFWVSIAIFSRTNHFFTLFCYT